MIKKTLSRLVFATTLVLFLAVSSTLAAEHQKQKSKRVPASVAPSVFVPTWSHSPLSDATYLQSPTLMKSPDTQVAGPSSTRFYISNGFNYGVHPEYWRGIYFRAER